MEDMNSLDNGVFFHYQTVRKMIQLVSTSRSPESLLGIEFYFFFFLFLIVV